jgi:PKD repeat protein
MKQLTQKLACAAWVFAALASGTAPAATLHVWSDSPSPVPPYDSWGNAARNIQEAVDVADAGDTVLVTNGVYATGGRAVDGTMTNRVVIDKAITVESLMGPEVTVIEGAPAPGGDNGDGAIRCVYLGTRAVLSGFTLTQGHTLTKGNYVTAESGGGAWCNYSAVLTNCILRGNSASDEGGGAYGGTLNHCTLTGNSAWAGGGAYYSSLDNCVLTGNSATYGGGAYSSGLHNCTVTHNSAVNGGGGVMGGGLYNCILYFNTAPSGPNYADEFGDYGETYPPTINYSCTTPPPADGANNISADPQLASLTHLSVSSPCIGAGRSTYATGVDIDGEPWADPPCMGADQLTPGQATGSLTMAIEAEYAKVATEFAVRFVAQNQGPILTSVWDFDDGTFVTNQAIASHAWNAPGTYTVRLTGYNDSFPEGKTTTVQIEVSESVYYVNQDNPTPLFPYTSWATAATHIQDAIEAGAMIGRLVLVTNGVYASGTVEAQGTNRMALTGPMVVRSVNGPEVTVIEGAPGLRCAYVGTNAILSGFTLTNGQARDGGGAWCEYSAVLTNCIVRGNSAGAGGGAYGGTLNHCTLSGNSAGAGGGASSGTLYNCTLTGNFGDWYGGGSDQSTLYNCVVIGNSALYGGGANSSMLYNCTVAHNSASNDHSFAPYAVARGGGVTGGALGNCIVYFNTAPSDPNYSDGVYVFGTPQPPNINYSCTTPLPAVGRNNITADPQLATLTHLSVSSPCIGAGSSTYTTGVDIDGEPWADPPCMGADQLTPGQATGALSMSIEAEYTNVAPNFVVRFIARNQGRILTSVWDFDDGTFVTNQPITSHAWSAPGNYTVRLTGFNDSFSEGVTATVQVEVPGNVYYVNRANPTPAFPYTSWETAATNIQKAIEAGSTVGRWVLVTNGVYVSGSVAVQGTNRIALSDTVRVRSVNGPEATVIEGAPGIRCAYLGSNAILSGFTLTKGYEERGGGAWCESSAMLTNCIVTGNSAASDGGGAYGGTLYNCILSGNSAASDGGGAYDGILFTCALTGNSAGSGGGFYGGTLYASLHNCTATGNSADDGGGVYGGTLYNCIVYYNFAVDNPNYIGCTFNYSCTTPLPDGPGNIDSEPLLVTSSHLSAQSPCIGQGSSAYASGVDIDGEPWADPPCMGADQLTPSQVMGPLSMAIGSDYTSMAPGFTVQFIAENQGPILATVWDFGDGTLVTNQPLASHSWSVPGSYTVRLTGYNDSFPGGVTTTLQVEVTRVHYVNQANPAPVFPYSSWETAATNIQDAVETRTGGGVVLVTNGVYASGTALAKGANRIALTYPIEVRSVNGPEVTVIEGVAGVRCAYLGKKALLNGFTLTKGEAADGGGAWCESSARLTNCIVTGNLASANGGGVSGGTLYHCTLSGNSATNIGGGAYQGTLHDCTLTGNSADTGGGAGSGTLFNCTLAANTAAGAGGAYDCELNDCTLSGNSSSLYGGGVFGGTLDHCMVTSNSADTGGGSAYATLRHCTVTGNSATYNGGGAYQSALYHCTLANNSAGGTSDGMNNGAGGGASDSTLYNCALTGNSAGFGGGASMSMLHNCTVTGNSAFYEGGGLEAGTNYNCIVYFNSAPSGPNYFASTFYYSCTFPYPPDSPFPSDGGGNISNAPVFVDLEGGNLRLQSNSPGINAGDNAYASGTTDLDGRPRIVGGTVDMGAYEFQTGISGAFIGWLQLHGLATDGSADAADLDGDHLNSRQEWLADTDPNDGSSFFHIEAISKSSPAMISVQSSSNRTYTLWGTPQLAPPDWTPVPGEQSIPGTGGTLTLSDPTNAPQRFYRVQVNLP